MLNPLLGSNVSGLLHAGPKGIRRRLNRTARLMKATDYVGQASHRYQICYLLFVIAPRGRYVSSHQHVIAEALEFWFLQRDSQFITTHTGSAGTWLVACG